MKKKISVALMLILTSALFVCTFAVIGFAEDTAANITDAPLSAGRTFEEGEGLHISEDLKAMPKTYEAVVYVPSTSAIGTIFGNYLNATTPSFNFLINSSGKPYLHITDQDGNQLKKAFNYSISENYPDSWVHVAITHTVTSSGSSFVCYVNGESVATASYNVKYELDMNLLQHSVTPRVGQDYRPTSNFKGRIKNIAVYSEPLSAEQVAASYTNGIDTTIGSLMVCYDLTEAAGKSNIADLSGNGNDVKPVFFEREEPVSDYDYSFAVVGDTQFLAEHDVYNGTDYFSAIYDWIVKNKDSKKIERVLGLGDITEDSGVDQTPDDNVDQTDAEWRLAVANFKKLEDEGIPYSITWGPGHDTVPKFNEYFAGRSNFTESDTYCYVDGSLENYYTKFDVGQTKYMVMSLRFTPEESVLKWASDAIAANKDRKVIVITHYYLEINAQIATDAYPIWENVISNNENVIMVLSGHVNYADNIIRSTAVGNAGHTVNQFLINPQYTDKMYGYDSTSTVAMFYFSNDGRDVKVEYISTVKTRDAQKNDENADDVLYGSKNQFEFTVPEISKTNVTKYGVIPDDLVSYPILVFKSGTCIGGYNDIGGDSGAIKAAKEATDGNLTGEIGSTVYILLRDDANSTNRYSNTGQSQGTIIIDLDGHTLSQTNTTYPLLHTQAKNYKGTANATVKILNGNVVLKTQLLVFDAYDKTGTYIPSGAGYKTFITEFSNVRFSYAAGSSSSSFLGLHGESITSGEKIGYDVTFNSCIFDFTGVSGMTCIMNTKDGNTSKSNCAVDVKINGCEFISGSSTPKIYDGESASVSFNPGADGAYASWTLASGAELPAESVNGGTLEFVKISEAGETVKYRLIPKEASALNFVPKMSLTLDRDLTINIYIPAHDKLTAVKLGDEILDLGDLELKDGYYVKSVALAAKKAASDIKLTATLNVDGKDIRGTFTFSTVKYAQKLLDDKNISDTEKTLVCDVLAYIRAAYAYFGTRDAETIAKINTLIGESYSNAPTAEGSATAETSGMKSVTFVLDGTPSMRFYLADGADASKYEFFIDGNRVKTETSADGKYIDIDVYAYALCETVTYTIDGVESGSFHINAYYSFVSGSSYTGADKAELVTLTEAFWRYLQSARDYRNSVVNG